MKMQCAACGKRFSGLSGFNTHRRGEYTNTPPDYGRRCLDSSALEARGFRPNARGVWVRPLPAGKRHFPAPLNVLEAFAPPMETAP